jgi:hypothetical protein
MEGNFTVKKKNAAGQFWSHGNVKKNQYGNYSLGLKVTAELRKVVEETADGGWINFSLFPDDGERKPKPSYAGDDRTDPMDQF